MPLQLATRYQNELRSLKRANAIVNVVGCAIFVCLVSWTYLVGRTLEIGPSITAFGTGILTGTMLGLPSIAVLLTSAYVRGHRSPKRFIRSTVILILFTVVCSEVYVSTQDLILRSREVNNGSWEDRWFPFDDLQIVYFDSIGWTVTD